MNKEKVISKGYLLKVTSWENDGDHYCTKEYHTENKQHALILRNACKTLFKSCNNNEGGIGNACDKDEVFEVVLDYVSEHKEILTLNDEPLSDDESIYYFILHLAYELMGGSEYYESRVCESAELYYCEEDVYLEKIS